MFCPKCGSNVKEGVKFCPKCGAQMENKKDSSEPVPKKKVPLIAGAAVILAVIAIVLLFSSLMRPKIKDSDVNELVGEYFQENTTYMGGEAQYRRCFEYMSSDLINKLTEKIKPMLSTAGVDLDSDASKTMLGNISNMLSEFFSNSENQITLANGICSASSYKAEKAKRDGDHFVAQVTVSGIDISEVNGMVIDDTVSIQGFVKLGLSYVFSGKGGLVGNTVKMASGDISFILDGFLGKVALADNRHTYTGEVEFEYDKKNKEWTISYVDPKLLDAYFGIR